MDVTLDVEADQVSAHTSSVLPQTPEARNLAMKRTGGRKRVSRKRSVEYLCASIGVMGTPGV